MGRSPWIPRPLRRCAALAVAFLASPWIACGDDGGSNGPGVVVAGPGGVAAGGGGSDDGGIQEPGGIGQPGGGGGGSGGGGSGGGSGGGGSGGGGSGGGGSGGGGSEGTVLWTSAAIADSPVLPPALLANGALALIDEQWQLHRFTANGGESGTFDLTFGLEREATHASAPVAGPDGLVVGMGWVDLPGCHQGGVLLPVPFPSTAGPVLDGTAQILEPPAVDGASLVWSSVLFKLNQYEGLCTKGPAQASQLSRPDAVAPVAAPLRGVAVAQDGSIRAVSSANQVKGYTDGLLETWTVETDGLTVSDPAIGADGVTYVTNGRHLVAISPSGAVLWDVLAPVEVATLTGQPAVTVEGLIVAPATAIGQAAGKNRPAAVAFHAADGAGAWVFVAPGAEGAPPAAVTCGTPSVAEGGRILLACGDGRAYGLGASGGVEWSADVDAVALSPILIDGGTLVVPTRSGLTAIGTGTSGLASGPWSRFRADNGSTGHAR